MNREAQHIDPAEADELVAAWAWRMDNCVLLLRDLDAEVRMLLRLDAQMHEPLSKGLAPVGRSRYLAEIEGSLSALQGLLDGLEP